MWGHEQACKSSRGLAREPSPRQRMKIAEVKQYASVPNEYLPGCPLGLLALHPAAPLELHDLDPIRVTYLHSPTSRTAFLHDI
jgi:hypothetical protein